MFRSHRLFHYLLAFGCFMVTHAQAQLSVANGERVSITSAGELVLLDDLVNNGTIDDLTLGGTASQSISGTGTIVNLKLSKTAIGNTATITGGMQSLIGTLDLTAGTLAAGGYLTLKSSSAGTARVATHTTAGAVTGTVKVERYIGADARVRQWRMLGFPYSTNLAIASITGIGKEFSTSTKTMMYFVEGNDDGRYGNSGARNTGYQTFSTSAENILPLTGVMAWLFGPTGLTATTGTMTAADSMTIVSSGTLYETGADVSVPLSYTLTKGWNLVANPFASNLDWSGITKNNVQGSVYRWNPQSADWTSHNGTTGTLVGGTAPTDAVIESGTAFFVRTEGATPSLTIPQSAKTASNTVYTHLTKAPFRLDIPGQRIPSGRPLSGIRVFSSGAGNPMPGDIYLDLSRPDATSGFDSQYDAWSMGRSSGADVALMGADDQLLEMQFDRPISEAGKEKRYYPLRVTGISTGSASLTLRTEGSWNPLNSVSLIDHQEGKTLLMRGNELRYDFHLESLKTEGRFTLAINHVKLDADGQTPAFEVKLLGNPVTSDRLQLLVTHPSAAARAWRVMASDGRLVGQGNLQQHSSVQHSITVPAMRNVGSYLLQVEMDNGELKSIPFLRK